MLHKKGAPKPATILDEGVSKIAKIGDQLAYFAHPVRNSDGSLNIKAAAHRLLSLGLLLKESNEPSTALSGPMSNEEILAAIADLGGLVERRSGKDPLKRLWRNLGDTVFGYRTGFKLKGPIHKHYENIDNQFVKGSLVAVMKHRCDVGLSPDEASSASWLARQILKEPRFSSLVGRGNKFSATTVLGWRRKCQTKKSAYRAGYRWWLPWLGVESLSESQCKAFISAIAETMLISNETT